MLPALLLCAPALSQVQTVKSFALNKYLRYLDGQWQGIRYASDGNVYFGSSTHSAHHGPRYIDFLNANMLALLDRLEMPRCPVGVGVAAG